MQNCLKNSSGPSINKCDVYDLTSKVWRESTPAPTDYRVMNAGLASLDNDKVLLVGGEIRWNSLTSKVMVFNTKTEVWSETEAYPGGKSH
jgi:N-acetylneuraminic acid mutarotase